MVKLFNKNHPSVYLSLLLLAALCHSTLLFSGFENRSIEIGAFSTFVNWIKGFSLAEFIVVVLLVFFISVFLHGLFIEIGSAPRSTHIPAAVFIILSSIVSQPQLFLANQASILFFLTAIYFLQNLETAPNEVNASFFTGFFICLASIFFPLAASLLLLVLIRIFESKWSISRVVFLNIVGFTIPFYLIWIIYFLNNNGGFFVDAYLDSFQFSLAQLSYSITDKLTLGFFLLIGLISVLSMMSSTSWKSIQPRGWLRFWLIAGIVFFVLALSIQGQNNAFQYTIAPVSGFLSFTLLAQKRKKLRAMLLYFILLISLLDQANSIGLVSLQ